MRFRLSLTDLPGRIEIARGSCTRLMDLTCDDDLIDAEFNAICRREGYEVIESDLTSASLVQDAFPGLGGIILLVREEDADAARRVIAEGRRSAPDEDVTAEIPAIEEPPMKP